MQSSMQSSAEHRRWTTVAKDSTAPVRPGDIFRVERLGSHPAQLIVPWSAADELASPE